MTLENKAPYKLPRFNTKSAGYLKVGDSMMTCSDDANCQAISHQMEAFEGWKIKTTVVSIYPKKDPLNGFKGTIVTRIK